MFPKPSPVDAPFTSPAISTNSTIAGITFSLLEIAERVTEKKAVREERSQRYGQTFSENISIEKAKELLDWEPKTSFINGMHETYILDKRYK